MSFYKRTICNGQVQINGVKFAPAKDKFPGAIEYDGRLEGTRWYFGTYANTDRDGLRFIALHSPVTTGTHNPSYFDDVYHWIWWKEVKE